MSGLLSFFLTLTLSELASAYPVAGAMASWAWKCARGGVGGERKWGWLLGGVVLAGHAAAVCPPYSLWIPLIAGGIGHMGDLRYHLGDYGYGYRLCSSDMAFCPLLPCT
jgi:amino acid transporter